ncbi:MAG: DUF1501 domain-containing protein [Bryobacterales bacterium]|nr:DUF1501 domain-containing protein [Bryobacterales bacterium]
MTGKPFQPPCGKVPRRAFLQDCGMGFAGLVLAAMNGRAETAGWRPPDGKPHFAPKAKSVIWLFMQGGTSHLESFDPKPVLNKYAGKTIGDTPYKGVLDSPLVAKGVRQPVPETRKLMLELMPIQVPFRKYGQMGIEMTDWWPHVGSVADDLTFIRSVWTTDNDHGAQYQFHTGRHFLDGLYPSIGSWIHYGLGSLNENLPQFVVLGEQVGPCCGGSTCSGAAYLGPEHSGVEMSLDPSNPLPFAAPPAGVSAEDQRREFDFIKKLGQMAQVRYPEDPGLTARIKSYELAFRMQTAVPDVFRFQDEPEHVRRLYGMDQEATRSFGERCLAARRMVERGVRFVQVYHGGGQASEWDAHSELQKNHSRLCGQVDQPIAGLIKDLKQRGLLDETIVVWGTEFGRTPGVEGAKGGRDHHPYGFTIWMAGAGLKPGLIHGATDELGFHAVENRHYVTDIHATVLHLLGLDPKRLDVPGQQRLEIDHGQAIREIMS